MRVAVTGANGNLGLRLMVKLHGSDLYSVRGIVRSKVAKEKITAKLPSADVVVSSFTDEQGLSEALKDCDVVIHLVGIIKQSASATFHDAHQASCETLARAALNSDLQRIIYLSILGVNSQSENVCLASKAAAEIVLRTSGIETTVIKVPMVLGEGDFASAALKKNAQSKFAFTFRAESLEQPIYAGDIIDVIYGLLTNETHPSSIELAGPESLSRRELINRASTLLENSTRVVSLPIWLGMLIARGLEFLSSPPITRAMLGVLDHDDAIDVSTTCNDLGIQLSSLDETLAHVLEIETKHRGSLDDGAALGEGLAKEEPL